MIGALAERVGVQATLAGQASVVALAVMLIVLRLPGVLRPDARAEQPAS
jgi:hypothetical protein